jgi:hypothetical protein
MMHLDISRALDPATIGADCGLTLDAWQADLMRSTAPRVLLLAARQTGKSATTAQVAIHTASSRPGALVIVVSPSQRQSGELFRTIMGFYRRLSGVPEVRAESALRVELSNGSRVIALPGTEATIRGYAAADLIVIDEAARVPDELLAATRPMLATSGGRLIALTTPAGKRGWFFEAWTGAADWHRVQVTADQCPRISKAFLDEELRALGAQRFSEEYGLQFLDPIDAVFTLAGIESMFSTEVSAWVL